MSKPVRPRPRNFSDPTHLLLTAQITFIYFLVLFLLVFLTHRFEIPLSQRVFPVLSCSWGSLLKVVYYAVPVVLSVLFGLVVRPFLVHFRNLFIAIFMVHTFYSVVSFGYRSLYLKTRSELVTSAKTASLKPVSLGNTFHDLDKDGRIDRVRFQVQMDMKEFPLGDYVVYATLTQKGQPLPEGVIGYFPVQVVKGILPVVAHFQVDPQKYEPYYESGDFELNLGVQRVLPFDKTGSGVITISRWSPFFRTTTWEGEDKRVRQSIVDVDFVLAVDVFNVMPLKLPRPQVTFRRFLGNDTRDLDWDGFFDELVVRFEVDSRYEGPVYMMANIEGGAFPIFYQTPVGTGRQELEFVIKSNDLRKFGFDGPYHLVDFQLFNQNPGCTTQDCVKNIKPFFRTYLDNYYTRDYQLEQFD